MREGRDEEEARLRLLHKPGYTWTYTSDGWPYLRDETGKRVGV
jgi:hypothetical protein